MIKKLRVTVDGKPYEVTVEMPEENSAPAAPAPAAVKPVAVPVVSAPTPAPVSAPAAGGSAGPGEVPSPLSGRVTAVMVSTGQEVKEGDHLVTLEAMKMNTFVFAPKSGKIAAVNVAVGDVVGEKQALAKIE